MSWQKSYMKFMGFMKSTAVKKNRIGTYTSKTDPTLHIQEPELRYANCIRSLAAYLIHNATWDRSFYDFYLP
jgi:hypothetical protein